MSVNPVEGREFEGGEAKGVAARVWLADGELLLGRFRIVRHLGSGGMGDVYEAIDLLMDGSRIALKTIRPDLISDAEQLSRFKNEVQLARRVTGLHVCRIHELFLADESAVGGRQAFLTMELLEGITVADRIRLSGPLPWAEARNVALDLCEALRCIHEAGVIHRDLKGRNIMLAQRNGSVRAVLMDFGIAREISRYTGNTVTALTQTGVILGTPDYMAPEQFEGRDVTETADIYALGILLFEIITGERPFSERLMAKARKNRAAKSGSKAEVSASIATIGNKASGTRTRTVKTKSRIPVSASVLQPEVPRRFDMVISRCLEYDPDRRYQSAEEVEEALRGRVSVRALLRPPQVLVAIAVAVVLLCGLLLVPVVGERIRGMLLSSSEKHIAILPLEVTGGNAEVVALGDGLMDSLAGDLANLDTVNRTLWVIPASEIRARNVTSASQAMREFGATIVISGSFERNASGARLNLTLTDPKKMREIGFVQVASPADDLAAMESDAITRLGRLMNLSVKDDLLPTGSASGGGAAYEDYLAGVGYFQRYDRPGNLDLAIKVLERAVKIDPRFSLGFARLAQVYMMKFRIDRNPQWLRQAEADCKQAAELNDRVPSTYVALAQVHGLTGSLDLAIEEYQRAASLDPRDSEAVAGLARSYQIQGRNAEAEEAYMRAAALRPNDWKGYNDLGNFYDNIGKPREAIAEFQRALQLTPDNSGLYSNLGSAYMDLDDENMAGVAEEALRHSIAINPTYIAYANLGFLYAAEHRFPESVEASQKALAINSANYDIWSNLTAAYEWEKNTQKANVARAKTISLLEQEVKLNSQDALAQATLAAFRAKDGARAQSLEGISISLALSPRSQYVLIQVADAYEVLGDRDNAIRYLQRAIRSGLPKQQLSEDPEIQGVLTDPRFKALGL